LTAGIVRSVSDQLPALKLRAWRGFLEAHSSITRELERELREERGLPLSWYDVLVQLNEAGGEMRMHRLASSLLLSRSATTRFVERLERAGLLVRDGAPDDRRGTVVRLTDQGMDTLRRAAGVHLRGVKRHFGDIISNEDAELLVRLMTKLAPPPSGEGASYS
jgi:DNA-binding MarR family transcriptional regulator